MVLRPVKLINVLEISWENELPDINLSVVPEWNSPPVLGVPFSQPCYKVLLVGLEMSQQYGKRIRVTW